MHAQPAKVFVGVKRKRCCECAGCTSPERGSCRFCLDMTKFGGPGKKKALLPAEMFQNANPTIH